MLCMFSELLLGFKDGHYLCMHSNKREWRPRPALVNPSANLSFSGMLRCGGLHMNAISPTVRCASYTQIFCTDSVTRRLCGCCALVLYFVLYIINTLRDDRQVQQHTPRTPARVVCRVLLHVHMHTTRSMHTQRIAERHTRSCLRSRVWGDWMMNACWVPSVRALSHGCCVCVWCALLFVVSFDAPQTDAIIRTDSRYIRDLHLNAGILYADLFG